MRVALATLDGMFGQLKAFGKLIDLPLHVVAGRRYSLVSLFPGDPAKTITFDARFQQAIGNVLRQRHACISYGLEHLTIAANHVTAQQKASLAVDPQTEAVSIPVTRRQQRSAVFRCLRARTLRTGYARA